jgi:hypothetical protein
MTSLSSCEVMTGPAGRLCVSTVVLLSVPPPIFVPEAVYSPSGKRSRNSSNGRLTN